MALVDWSDELSVCIPEVDAEHQTLVAILNALDEAMRSGKGTRIMGQILARLLDYTETHFKSAFPVTPERVSRLIHPRSAPRCSRPRRRSSPA